MDRGCRQARPPSCQGWTAVAQGAPRAGATWAASVWMFVCQVSRPCLACSSSRLAGRRRPKRASAERLARA